MTINYTIERKVKGTRVLFYSAVNGRRINNTNYARKYDARNLITAFSTKYTQDEILDKLK